MLASSFTKYNNQYKIRPAESWDAWKISNERNNGDWLQLHDSNLYNEYNTKQWLENMPRSSKRFIIETVGESTQDGIFIPRVVGIIRIDHIDTQNGNCLVGADIYDAFKGKGLARPIYGWLFWYLFDQLNMHVLYLEVLSTNKLAISLYEKLGFKQVGMYPQKIFRNGEYVDSLLFSMLREDYKAKSVTN